MCCILCACPDDPTFGEFKVQQVKGLFDIYGKDIEKGGQLYPALLSDSTLDQFEVYKTLVCERDWGKRRFLCWCLRVCVCVPSICVRENLSLHLLNFVCVCA
jgi:hypothetical protein